MQCRYYTKQSWLYQSLSTCIDKNGDKIEGGCKKGTERPKLLFQSMTYSANRFSIYEWMDCVILGLQLISLVETQPFRKHFKHNNICVKTIMKYMQTLTTFLEEKLQTYFQSRLQYFLTDGK